MNIAGHTIEKLEDPFGLLSGERYEIFLDLEVDEEDELFSPNGIGIRIIFVKDQDKQYISHYHLFEKASEKVLDFELEEDEEELILNYCKEQIQE